MTFMTGLIPGVLAYLVAWMLVPLEPLPQPVRQPAEQHNEGTV